MEDFKFSKFFGVNAPMAVLMGPSRFEDIVKGVKSSVGGKMLNSLKLELESLKYFLVEGIEFSQTVDTDSEDYLNFIKGLKLFLNSKNDSVVETPTSSSAGKTSAFDNLVKEDSLAQASTSVVGEADDGFDDLMGGLELPDAPSAETDDMDDLLGGLNLLGSEFLSLEDIVPEVPVNLIQMGKEYEGEPECSVPLNNHSKVVMFFLKLKDKSDELGLSTKEVESIQHQYQELPVTHTGRIKFLRDGRIVDLETECYEVYHILLTLYKKATAMYENRPLIDYMIDLTTQVVMGSSIDTRKFLGQNFTILTSCHASTIEKRMMETLSSDSNVAKLQRIDVYIQDCKDLLNPRSSRGDKNVLREAQIKVNASGGLGEAQDQVIPKLTNCGLFPQFLDDTESVYFNSFIQLCLNTNQFGDIFASLETVNHIYTIYKEIIRWNNTQWMEALNMVATDDPDQAGSKFKLGARELLYVSPDFNIDDYCEELLMKYDIIGITTKNLVFFSDSLKLIGRLNTSEQYTIDRHNNPGVSATVSRALVQLMSLRYRLSHPIKSFWG